MLHNPSSNDLIFFSLFAGVVETHDHLMHKLLLLIRMVTILLSVFPDLVGVFQAEWSNFWDMSFSRKGDDYRWLMFLKRSAVALWIFHHNIAMSGLNPKFSVTCLIGVKTHFSGTKHIDRGKWTNFIISKLIEKLWFWFQFQFLEDMNQNILVFYQLHEIYTCIPLIPLFKNSKLFPHKSPITWKPSQGASPPVP